MNEANRSSFTSYSLVLMVIHYLQCKGARDWGYARLVDGAEPPVLPSLHKLYPKRFHSRSDVRQLVLATLDQLVCEEDRRASRDTFHCRNRMTLGELLIGFLDYFRRFEFAFPALLMQ
jgi:poly(A) RNA polymerase GLD2